MAKLKYLSVLILPISVWISFTQHGIWCFLPGLVFFAFVPLFELVFPAVTSNLSSEDVERYKNDIFYDLVLYILVPIQWIFIVFFLMNMREDMGLIDRVGRISSLGIMCGVIGINVGHELGHRTDRAKQFLGELLLLSSLETHFLPYHNSGHHANAGTFEDPATARPNETVYRFIIRSHFGSYLQAWKFENQRMRIQKRSMLNASNRMVVYTVVQVLLLLSILLIFGWLVLINFFIAASIGVVLLEIVNYIEHYGLMRRKRENGTYEVFKRCHAWNANQVASRILLFELSRHSDHHVKPDKPYQILACDEESPVMPTGYAGMMLLSLIPSLFFNVMNPRVEKALGK